MTQDVPLNYQAELDRLDKIPVHVVEFEGIATRFSTQQIKNQAGPTSVYLSNVSGAGSQITVDEGRSSIGSIKFSIIDKDGEVRDLLSKYTVQNKKVTVTTGFIELDESDYVRQFVGKVLTYTLESDNVTWTFEAIDLWKQANSQIMTAVTSLTAGMNSGQSTASVVGAAPFAAATGTEFYIKIDDEVMSYTGKTATSFTGLSRGALGTAAASHSSGVEVVNFIVLNDNAINIVLRILTSTGLGTNGPYDDLPASAGLGIDQSEIAVTRMEQERNRWLQAFDFQFEFAEKEDAKQFVEKEIYRFINAYPIIDNEGRISTRVYTPPLPTQTVEEFTDDDLVGAPTWQGNIMDRYFFNEIDIQHDFNFTTGKFDKRTIAEDSTSQVTFNEVKTLKIDSRGLRTSVIGQAKINTITLRFLRRFGNPTPIIGAKTFMTKRIVENGDIVLLTSSHIPNLDNGQMGVTAQMMEAIQIGSDFKRGSVRFTLLNTAFSYGKKYGAISPSTLAPISFPDWNVATAAQRNYAFICTKVSSVKGVMSDGSDAYYITF